MKRVNIQLPKAVHTKAKILSVLKGRTLNDYLADAILDKVTKDAKLLSKIEKRLEVDE